VRDQVSIARVGLLHPKIREDAALAIEEAEAGLPANMAVRATQTLRTKLYHDALYAQGRTKPGKIVTKAKWYQTYHFYGLALDYALLVDKNGDGRWDELSWSLTADKDNDNVPEWNEVADVFIQRGFDWGGKWRTFKDWPHVEKLFGYHWSKLYEMHKAGKFIRGTGYLDI
jgi:peptidoglycan L-alanyl-D-glutamate endopeptidase CwlK